MTLLGYRVGKVGLGMTIKYTTVRYACIEGGSICPVCISWLPSGNPSPTVCKSV